MDAMEAMDAQAMLYGSGSTTGSMGEVAQAGDGLSSFINRLQAVEDNLREIEDGVRKALERRYGPSPMSDTERSAEASPEAPGTVTVMTAWIERLAERTLTLDKACRQLAML